MLRQKLPLNKNTLNGIKERVKNSRITKLNTEEMFVKLPIARKQQAIKYILRNKNINNYLNNI